MIIFWIIAGAVGWGYHHKKRKQQFLSQQLDHHICDVADMLAVLLLSGLSTAQALQQVHRYTDAPLHEHLHDSAQLLTHGARLRDVVNQLRHALGTRAFPLCEALLASERDGLAIGPLLDRLGAVSRQQRKQLEDSTARQLPIRMALPLVGCVLPSFVLLGIVPLFAGSFIGFDAHI